MAPLIEVNNLHIRFGAAEAVRGIHFELADGEVLGLVGESGSGKSATALAVLGLLGASVNVMGKILWRARDDASPMGNLLDQPTPVLRDLRGREISMIFQEPMTALNPVMSVGRQVAECAAAHVHSLTGRE